MAKTVKSRTILFHADSISRSVAFLREKAPEIARRANDDSFGGVRSSMGGGNTRSGGHSDPVEAAVTRGQDDPAGRAAKTLVEALRTAEKAIAQAARAGLSLLALDENTARRLEKESNLVASAMCANPACGIIVENTREDRLREGRCRNCFQWRKTHNPMERPRTLCDKERCDRGQMAISADDGPMDPAPGSA